MWGSVSARAKGSVARVTLPHRRNWVPIFGCLVSQPPRRLTILEGVGEPEWAGEGQGDEGSPSAKGAPMDSCQALSLIVLGLGRR